MKIQYTAIVLAAGKGARMHLDYNKMFYRLQDGTTILEKSVNLFLADEDCVQVVLMTTREEENFVRSLFDDERMTYAYGGETRQDSVYNGLQAVTSKYVMIHDGARCFLAMREIEALKEALTQENACLLMVPAIDTIKEVKDGYVVHTPKRSTLYAAQTPQCFLTEIIRDCYAQADRDGFVASDDAMLVEHYSCTPIKVVLGSYGNKKVTTKEDLE